MVRYVGLEDSEDIQHTDNTADCDEVTFPPPGALSWSRLGTGDRLHVTVVRVWPQVTLSQSAVHLGPSLHGTKETQTRK